MIKRYKNGTYEAIESPGESQENFAKDLFITGLLETNEQKKSGNLIYFCIVAGFVVIFLADLLSRFV